MRRIPRPQRAIESSHSLSPLVQRRISPPSCLRAIPPHPHLCSTSAAFSTTPTFNFLHSDKQDKKKHQQFVRRWQKRLFGESEPIGARVDPYDPTSPVRIAPEELGEEEEVLDDAAPKRRSAIDGTLYSEATHAKDLLHVGGKQYTDRVEERRIAKEFEKLTLRTYTPLSVKMAKQIEEDLTGSFYTLRDGNLMMGQTFEALTGKPYTEASFGPWTRVRSPDTLRRNFHRAVVEIYALKQSGRTNLDISAQANRGVYDAPKWIKDVKLHKSGNDDYVLSLPGQHTLDELLKEIEQVPAYTPPVQAVAQDGLSEESPLEEEILVEEKTAEAEPQPTMDPATPAFKRAAVVKQDPDQKKFDFMSNWPVPREKPIEPVQEAKPVEPAQEVKPVEPVQEVTEAVEPVQAEPVEPVQEVQPVEPVQEVNPVEPVQEVAETAQEVVVEEPPVVSKPTPSLSADAEAKWGQVPLTDLAIKFAMVKRIAQLTGHYIPDRHLASINTLGDLYHHICGAAKPTTSKVYSYIHAEGGRQNHKVNMLTSNPSHNPSLVANQKPNVGELLKLKNVEILRKRPNKKEQRVKIGLHKEIRKTLAKKGLIMQKTRRSKADMDAMVHRKTLVAELGVPVPFEAAHELKRRTGKLTKTEAGW